LINAFDAIKGKKDVIELSVENITISQDRETLYGTIPAGKYVKIMVRDNGCGIPDEYLPKIFNFGDRLPCVRRAGSNTSIE
jgi:signal transduction histidine kinase